MAKSITVALELDTRKFDQGIKKVDQGLDNVSDSASKTKSSLLGVAAGVTAIAGAAAGLVSAVNAARSVEDLGITLKALYGDAETAAAALDIVTESAAKLPVSLEAIQAGIPSLALVEDQFGGLGNTIEFTSGIANAFGMSFEDAASNVQRALSAGIASADTFRDRGVKAFLGFQEGVKYTAEQTQEMFLKSFEKVTVANEDAVKTMSGQFSMFEDALFQVQAALGETFNDSIKEILTNINDAFAENKEQILAVASALGEALGTALTFVIENMKFLAAAMAGAFAAAAVGRVIAIVEAVVAFTNAVRAAATAATILQGVTGIGLVKVGVGLTAAGASLVVMNELFDEQAVKIDLVTDASDKLNATGKDEARAEQLANIAATAEAAAGSIAVAEETKQASMTKTNDLMAASHKMLDDLHERNVRNAERIIELSEDRNEQLSREIEIHSETLGLAQEEASLKEKLMNLEFGRRDALSEIAAMLITDAERIELTKQLNELTDEQIDLVKERHKQTMDAAALEMSTAEKNEKAKVALTKEATETMADLNTTAMGAMEGAFMNFVNTGKLSFKDLIDDMINQLKRIVAKKIFMTIIDLFTGGTGSLFAGLFDQGGVIPSGKFGIVGEKGPEIVTGPAKVIGRKDTERMMSGSESGGNSTYVTYNISAVDAPSFRELIASDPSFIYNVTTQGARMQPI